jgi:hypothetical protein
MRLEGMSKFKLKLIILICFILTLNLCIFGIICEEFIEDRIQGLEFPESSFKISESPNFMWSGIEVLSQTSVDDSFYPELAVDSLGNVHVVWYDTTDLEGSDIDVLYRRWNATSTSWMPIEIVSIGSTTSSLYPAIATDIHNNAHIVWYDATNYSGAGPDNDVIYRSWNASTDQWSSIQVISTESTGSSLFPSIFVDNYDNIHIAWEDSTNYMGAGEFDSDIFYKYYNRTSGIWNNTQVISYESYHTSTFPSTTVDQYKNVHIVWEDYSNYDSSGSDADLFYKFWNSTTGEWSITDVLTTDSKTSSYPKIVLGPLGKIHLVWQEESPSSWYNVFYQSLNVDTGSWSPLENVTPTDQSANSINPAIAVDLSGNIHVVWADESNYEPNSLDLDVFYKYRNVSTGLWGPSEVIATTAEGGAWATAVGVDNMGRLHVVWDERTSAHHSGSDRDILYRKFAEPSEKSIPGYSLIFVLLLIGLINISWYLKPKLQFFKRK